ncbi:helix-turn-helix domain containing protein [Paenibacillus larvae]|nr:helix-turn-helix domain-containing protein [Paenibacillus larvae]MDT2276924.1 helix-turn-helix domain containing protein [Paenibacillus larvae]
MDKHTELAKVTAAMQQTKERRMYERYQAIYLHLKGTSMKAIADILNRNRMTVSSYIHTYENGGLGAFANQAFLRCSYSVDEAAAGSLETNRRLFGSP